MEELQVKQLLKDLYYKLEMLNELEYSIMRNLDLLSRIIREMYSNLKREKIVEMIQESFPIIIELDNYLTVVANILGMRKERDIIDDIFAANPASFFTKTFENVNDAWEYYHKAVKIVSKKLGKPIVTTSYGIDTIIMAEASWKVEPVTVIVRLLRRYRGAYLDMLIDGEKIANLFKPKYLKYKLQAEFQIIKKDIKRALENLLNFYL